MERGQDAQYLDGLLSLRVRQISKCIWYKQHDIRFISLCTTAVSKWEYCVAPTGTNHVMQSIEIHVIVMMYHGFHIE